MNTQLGVDHFCFMIMAAPFWNELVDTCLVDKRLHDLKMALSSAGQEPVARG